MTPKEKAEELYLKYRPIIAGKQFLTGFVLTLEAKNLTKQCALIAVNEIIQTYHSPMDDEQIQEWQEVKQEIEKL